MDDAKWQSAYELNLLSTIRLVREVLPHMRKAGGGVIINLQSTSVKVPLDNLMTDRLRQMVGMRAQKLGKTFEELQRAREAEIPLGRIGDPEDVANMIVFLASDRVRYVTGVTVQVDGGLVRSIL